MTKAYVQFKRHKKLCGLKALVRVVSNAKDAELSVKTATEFELKSFLKKGLQGFSALRLHCIQAKEKADLAQVFADSALMIKCFHALARWASHRSREQRAWDRAAEAHAAALLRRPHRAWAAWARERARLREYQLRVLGGRIRLSFTVLLAYRDERRMKAQSRLLAGKHHKSRMKSKGISKLCIMASKVFALQEVLATSAKHFKQKQGERLLRRLAARRGGRRAAAGAAAAAAAWAGARRRRAAVAALRGGARRRRRLRGAYGEILRGARRGLAGRVWSAWGGWARARTLARQVEDAMVQHAAGAIAAGRRRRAFQGWADWYGRRAVKQLKVARALGHRSGALLRRCLLRGLKAYAAGRRRARARTLAALRFRGLCLQKLCFGSLKRWRLHQLEMRSKTVESLWHWKRVTEERAFSGWRWYVSYRRKKHARRARAWAWRRQRLVREGCTKLIQAAAAIRQEKMQLLLNYEAEHTKKVWARVARYARYWWRVARARRRRRALAAGGVGVPLGASQWAQAPPHRRTAPGNYLAEDVHLRPYLPFQQPIALEDSPARPKAEEEDPLAVMATLQGLSTGKSEGPVEIHNGILTGNLVCKTAMTAGNQGLVVGRATLDGDSESSAQKDLLNGHTDRADAFSNMKELEKMKSRRPAPRRPLEVLLEDQGVGGGGANPPLPRWVLEELARREAGAGATPAFGGSGGPPTQQPPTRQQPPPPPSQWLPQSAVPPAQWWPPPSAPLVLPQPPQQDQRNAAALPPLPPLGTTGEWWASHNRPAAPPPTAPLGLSGAAGSLASGEEFMTRGGSKVGAGSGATGGVLSGQPSAPSFGGWEVAREGMSSIPATLPLSPPSTPGSLLQTGGNNQQQQGDHRSFPQQVHPECHPLASSKSSGVHQHQLSEQHQEDEQDNKSAGQQMVNNCDVAEKNKSQSDAETQTLIAEEHMSDDERISLEMKKHYHHANASVGDKCRHDDGQDRQRPVTQLMDDGMSDITEFTSHCPEIDAEIENISAELEQYNERRTKWIKQKSKLKRLHAKIQKLEEVNSKTVKNEQELQTLLLQMAALQTNIQDFLTWREEEQVLPRIQTIMQRLAELRRNHNSN